MMTIHVIHTNCTCVTCVCDGCKELTQCTAPIHVMYNYKQYRYCSHTCTCDVSCIHNVLPLYTLFIHNVLPLSGRWQAPAAVLPKEPKDKRYSHSRARRAREWPKHASPRARRARGRAKLSARFDACQCYYMFFTIQPKIAIFMAQFKYLNDGQNA